jgi:glucan phosphoethanolaminetransferase (alkaline phosphatase superfamily)
VANTQWLDRSQPQTLYFANILIYFDAAWWLLYLLVGTLTWFTILALPAVFAGLGIANEKKAGYWGACVVAVLNMLLLIDWFVAAHGQSLGIIVSLIFGGALLALLLHPMSRSYQRIWFKKLDRRDRRYR